MLDQSSYVGFGGNSRDFDTFEWLFQLVIGHDGCMKSYGFGLDVSKQHCIQCH